MKKHYIQYLISLACLVYAVFAVYTMMFENRTPFSLKAVGVKLKQGTVVALSSKSAYRPKKDTILIDYPQSKAIMPSTLGYIYYDNNEFVLKTAAAVSKPSKSQGNYFLPFARTMNEGWFEKAVYFDSNQKIPQKVLMERGVKFNSAVGTKETRVSVQLLEHEGDLFVKTNSEGLGVSYLVQSDVSNRFEVVFNHPTATDIPNVFLFSKTTLTDKEFIIDVYASAFSCNYKVLDSNRRIIKEGDQSTKQFIVNDILFELTPKYTIIDEVWLIFSLFCLLYFQWYLLKALTHAQSPAIKSIIALRIAVNNLSFLGIPIYLTALYLSPHRYFYLLAILLLNVSVFISVNWLTKTKVKPTKIGQALLWLFLLGMPIVMYFFTTNENLFGIIPVLHVQKVLIILMLLSTQNEFLKGWKYWYWGRFVFISGYAAAISLISQDMGSLIYTFLAFGLIELVKKTIRLRYAISVSLALVMISAVLFNIFYRHIDDRKLYRIVAPYTLPDDEKLIKFHQGDRETYSSLILNLKNVLANETPLFNDLVIPGNMRSTCFSDFAFYWSLSLGQGWFLALFTLVIAFFIADLTFLLFASTRTMRITKEDSFFLPRTREGEFVRFIIAFAIITFTFPIASNLLMIPITGQSIPALSISSIESAFLALLFLPLTSVFLNPKYIHKATQINYTYHDAQKSRLFALTFVTIILILGLAIRLITLYQTNSTLSWKKENAEQKNLLLKSIPSPTNKTELVNAAKQWIGDDDLTSVHKDKKTTLKNLASLYYSNRPYNQMYPEGAFFSNSTDRLLSQMSVDSIFALKKILISSGGSTPFGSVFRFSQRINEKKITKYTNKYYSSIPEGATSIQPNLTAECAYTLEKHLIKIGDTSKGTIWIVDNQSGAIITNSSIPLTSDKNMAEVHFLIGSLKKSLIAYCALKIDPDYAKWTTEGKNFEQAMQFSENTYWAALLRDVYQKHRKELDETLQADFGLPLHSLTQDAYFDTVPSSFDNSAALDSANLFYRTAIGQQRPYMFRDVVQWYARIASGLKLRLSYRAEETKSEQLAFEESERAILVSALNKVLWGSANGVRLALEKHRINTDGLICKTGTAQLAKSQRNGSSSFILCNQRYTIGIMLKGDLPPNDASMGAKHLFAEMIPLFKKYNIL